MLDDLLRVIGVQNASAVGVLLAVIIFHGIALYKEWIITGPRWRQKLADHDKLQSSLEGVQIELKQVRDELVETRIELERLRARIEERSFLWEERPPRPPSGGATT